jgi:hypothetical protein
VESERKSKWRAIFDEWRVNIWTALGIMAIITAVCVFCSCSRVDKPSVIEQPVPVTQNPRVEEQQVFDHVFEECFKGVTYAVFQNGGHESVTVEFDTDGNVVTCDQ